MDVILKCDINLKTKKNVGKENDSYILIHEYQELLIRGRESLCNF